MQADGALQRESTIPQHRGLKVLVAIAAMVLVAAVVALLIWAAPFARSTVGTQDAAPNAGAGSAAIHDDAGYVHRNLGAGSAVIHDDPGNVHPN